MNTKEKIEVMQAYLDGKEIEQKKNCYSNDKYEWNTWQPETEPCWNWGTYTYRIKKEPIYTCHSNYSEFFVYALQHRFFVKHKVSGDICCLSDVIVTKSPLVDLFENYVWADDLSVIGILKKEE